MWTQLRLAEEAGISPTTVSGIESGRISRPHFGTLRKLAVALGVVPEGLLPHVDVGRGFPPEALSLEWSMSSGDEEVERGLEAASIEGFFSLSEELYEEKVLLRRLHGEARGSAQRRLIKGMIRQVAANSGSVETSISAHEDKDPEHSPERRQPEDGHPGSPGPSTCQDLAWLLPVADTEAGSLGVPEEDDAVLGHHVRHPDEVPIVPVAFFEGVLDLLHDVRVPVHRELLGVVPAVRLVCHAMFSFPSLLDFTV